MIYVQSYPNIYNTTLNHYYNETHHSRLVVVLAGRQWSEAGALPGRVVEGGRNLALPQLGVEVDSVPVLGDLGGLGVRIKSAKAVAGAAGRPVLGNGQDEGEGGGVVGRGGGVTDPLGQPLGPVGGLVVIGGADDGDVVQGRICGVRHDGQGGIEGFLLHLLLGGGGRHNCDGVGCASSGDRGIGCSNWRLALAGFRVVGFYL